MGEGSQHGARRGRGGEPHLGAAAGPRPGERSLWAPFSVTPALALFYKAPPCTSLPGLRTHPRTHL